MGVLRDVIGLIGGVVDRVHDWITGGRPRLLPIPTSVRGPRSPARPSSFPKPTDR